MIKVSVIVPVWNVEKYLPKCLNSLVNQTLEDIEIIVVNDGSPDNSLKIINRYKEEYPNKIVLINQKNGGQGSARNTGLKYAKGEYIAYVDSDDDTELNMFEIMYEKAKYEKADVLICENFNVNELTLKKYHVKNANYSNEEEKAFLGKMAVWNKIYKRELLIDNDLKFKERVWYEDLAFTLKALINAKKISFVNTPLYNYLIRSGSTMNNSNVKRNLEIFDAFDDITSYLKEHNIYEEYYDRLEFLAVDHIYISAIVRVINSKCDRTKKLEIIKEMLNYLDKNFNGYQNNKYIPSLTTRRKIIFKLIEFKMYSLVKIVFKIKRGVNYER